MKTVPIRLNFYPLVEQNIRFTVFRQEYRGQDRQEGFYKAKLPVHIEEDEYVDYWIQLQSQDGFNEFICEAHYNFLLTRQILWRSLLQLLRSSNLVENDHYIINQERFHKNIAFLLARHNEGSEIIKFEPYYFKSGQKFGFLADYSFKMNDNVGFSKRVQQLSLSLDASYRSNRNFYSDKYDKLQLFVSRFMSSISPLVIGDQEHQIDSQLESVIPDSLQKREYIFGGNAVDESQFNGLKRYSPYQPGSDNPYFVFIFPPKYKNYANEVYSAMSGRSYPNIFPGLQKMFGIDFGLDRVDRIEIPSYSRDDLLIIDSRLDEIIRQHPGKSILGVFIEHDQFSQEIPGFSPYYFVKYLFTKKQLPLQAVTIETIRTKDKLKWSSSNIGLQAFAKLGGKPWKVKPSNEKCVILGLGSIHDRDSEGNISRYLAYSVCLDSSGIYRCLDVLGKSDNRTTYLDQFSDNIIQAIAKQLGDDVHTCVVHVPFKVSKDEIARIKAGLVSLEEEHENIHFLCIKINTRNKYFGYAENNSRVPYESSYIKLSNSEYLVWLEGLHYGKENVYKRVGNPIHVEFLHSSSMNGNGLTEQMKNNHLQDIINLSGANWRGFNAKLSPISIYYPQLIAKYISEFKNLNDENELDISELAEPWFL